MSKVFFVCLFGLNFVFIVFFTSSVNIKNEEKKQLVVHKM